MVCVYCSSPTQVINSRHQKRLNQVWRRRQCVQCSNIFTTHEAIELVASWMIKDERKAHLEPFNRQILFISIYESCKHRSTSVADATALTETVISLLRKSAAGGVLGRNVIAKTTANVLERFDTTASTMYQAYHPIHVKKKV